MAAAADGVAAVTDGGTLGFDLSAGETGWAEAGDAEVGGAPGAGRSPFMGAVPVTIKWRLSGSGSCCSSPGRGRPRARRISFASNRIISGTDSPAVKTMAMIHHATRSTALPPAPT